MALITLKYPTKCAECGAVLQAGEQAKFYATGIYGIACHSRQATQSTDDLVLGDRPPRRKGAAHVADNARPKS